MDNNPTVLVVEDESDVRELLALHLKREGFNVKSVDDGEMALEKLRTEKFDLVILDWMLPGMSGLDVCKNLRGTLNTHTAVLLLTARADTMDKVLGLEIGADDYLTKPFEVKEFVARVRALIRRSNKTPQNPSSPDKAVSIVIAGPFKSDLSSKKFFIDGIEISLTPGEFKLMTALMQKPGVTFERSELVRIIQGGDIAVVERTIDTQVLGLRKKLGKYTDHVETVRGFGYRFKSND